VHLPIKQMKMEMHIMMELSMKDCRCLLAQGIIVSKMEAVSKAFLILVRV